ncbi:MAG: hypothetical protein CMJ62_03235 [Planctomycetaceae bacterium]|nr:hypothetical protein [Planctomycetaceae bacterium]
MNPDFFANYSPVEGFFRFFRAAGRSLGFMHPAARIAGRSVGAVAGGSDHLNDLTERLLETNFLEGEDLIDRVPLSIGRYRIARVLGEGASGRVYLAHDPRIGRKVAIKVLQPGAARDPDKFERQIRLEASLQHENIVSIYDAGCLEGRPYFVMQFVGERTLADATLDLPAAVAALCSVARACGVAHARGIIHRDLKPANIVLADEQPAATTKGENPLSRAVVADFGLARLLDTSATQSGRVAGTPAYMAPEQALHGTASPQTDIYAVGVMLYEQLTGRLPFHGESLAEMTENLLATDPPLPRTVCLDIPGKLEQVTLRAMARDPQARYGSAEELARDLESWLGAQDGSVTAGHRDGNFTRSPWTVGGKAAAVTALLTVVVLLTAWFSRQERRAAAGDAVNSGVTEQAGTGQYQEQQANVLRAAVKLANWRRELYQPDGSISTTRLVEVLSELEPLSAQTDLPGSLRQQALFTMAEARSLSGDVPGALADLSSAVGTAGDPQQQADCYYQRALLHWDAMLQSARMDHETKRVELHTAALEDFRQAVRLGLSDPWQDRLACALIMTAEVKVNWQQTFATLAELEASPEKPGEHAARIAGDLLLLAGRHQLAIEKYQTAIRRCGSYAQAYGGLALACHAQNDLAGALHYAVRAVEINPRYQPAYTAFDLLARRLIRQAPADFRSMHFTDRALLDRCLSVLGRSRENLPDSSRLLAACGSLHLLQACQLMEVGDRQAYAESQRAKSRFAEAVAVDSGNATARLLAGMTCLFVGRYHSHLQADLDAACHYFRQALAMKIDRAHTYRWLGYAELAAHRPAEAIVNWEKSQRLEPSLHGELEPRIARASAGVQLANRQDGETVTNFGS